jgi:hypothetical protein
MWPFYQEIAYEQNGKSFVGQRIQGLGIKNHDKMNIFLFCKWWWKLENNVGSFITGKLILLVGLIF